MRNVNCKLNDRLKAADLLNRYYSVASRDVNDNELPDIIIIEGIKEEDI